MVGQTKKLIAPTLLVIQMAKFMYYNLLKHKCTKWSAKILIFSEKQILDNEKLLIYS